MHAVRCPALATRLRWMSRNTTMVPIIHLRRVETCRTRRGGARGVSSTTFALAQNPTVKSQPKYNAFSTAVYGPVTPYECTPASSHTSDGPKRTAAGAAGRINQSQGRCEGRKFRFQLLLCVYSTPLYSALPRVKKNSGRPAGSGAPPSCLVMYRRGSSDGAHSRTRTAHRTHATALPCAFTPWTQKRKKK